MRSRCWSSHSLDTSVCRFGSLTGHKLTQKELASFSCQINKPKESLEASGCIKGDAKELTGEQAGSDSLQQEGCGMHGAVAPSPGGAPHQAAGQTRAAEYVTTHRHHHPLLCRLPSPQRVVVVYAGLCKTLEFMAWSSFQECGQRQ